jgi:HEAT repeat protein
MGRMGETRAVAPLIGLLSDCLQPVRQATARALGRIGEKAAVPHLIEALKDEDDQVRAAAARALGRIGHNAVAELLDALEDDSVWVRAAISNSMTMAIGDFSQSFFIQHWGGHIRRLVQCNIR